MSLEMCAKVENLPVEKQTGKLDYDKIRHSETILTDDELMYCEYDVIVLYEYMKKKLVEEKGHLRKISIQREETGVWRLFIGTGIPIITFKMPGVS